MQVCQYEKYKYIVRLVGGSASNLASQDGDIQAHRMQFAPRVT